MKPSDTKQIVLIFSKDFRYLLGVGSKKIDSGNVLYAKFGTPVPVNEKNIDILIQSLEEARSSAGTSESTVLGESQYSFMFLSGGGKVASFLKEEVPRVLLVALGSAAASVLASLLIGYGVQKVVKGVTRFKTLKVENAIRQMDKEMFEKGAPDSAFEEYAILMNGIKNLLRHPSINSLIVLGRPGTGKTYCVRRTLYKNNVDYKIIRGANLDLESFFRAIYDNRNENLLLLDDFDSSLKNEAVISVLKSAVDTYKVRQISIPHGRLGQVYGEKSISISVPDKFTFKPKIILITNLPMDQIDSALLSRSIVCEIKFDLDQTLTIITKMKEYIARDVPKHVKDIVLKDLMDLVAQYKGKKELNVDIRKIETLFNVYHYSGPETGRKLMMSQILGSDL